MKNLVDKNIPSKQQILCTFETICVVGPIYARGSTQFCVNMCHKLLSTLTFVDAPWKIVGEASANSRKNASREKT